MVENKNIRDIETELEELLSADKKSWVKIYELMERVEAEKLYADEHRSFTAWVNALAEKTKVHVSLLWSRKKAGKVYSAYEARAQARGKIVPKMDEVKVSADNFNLIEKIAGNNESVADELIDKVLEGSMKRSDLKNAWEIVRGDRDAAVKKNVRKNAHDAGKIEIEKGLLTAADIILALSSSTWLPDTIEEKYVENKYRVITEFPVRTGTSRHARRIDALVLENHTLQEKNYNLHLHAIEIKVSKSDLLGDQKMQDYRNYADYFWLAVPEELEEDARSIIANGWGIILIDRNKELKVAIEATEYDAAFRDETIAAALIKML